MARSVSEIFDDIISTFSADNILGSLLTSQSKAAYYRLVAHVYAVITNQFEVNQDLFEDRVEGNIINQKVAQLPWYQLSSLDFQLGYSLIVDENYQLVYPEIDEDAKIVTRAAATAEPGIINLKVAKDGNNGTLEQLAPNELAAFIAYWDDYDVAPSFLQISSNAGDIIDIVISVTLNPQVFDLSTGLLLKDGSDPIGDTILNYLSTFSAANFNGFFYISQLNSELIAITGVEGVVFNTATASPSSGSPITDILAEPNQAYNPVSGYFDVINKTVNVL